MQVAGPSQPSRDGLTASGSAVALAVGPILATGFTLVLVTPWSVILIVITTKHQTFTITLAPTLGGAPPSGVAELKSLLGVLNNPFHVNTLTCLLLRDLEGGDGVMRSGLRLRPRPRMRLGDGVM